MRTNFTSWSSQTTVRIGTGAVVVVDGSYRLLARSGTSTTALTNTTLTNDRDLDDLDWDDRDGWDSEDWEFLQPPDLEDWWPEAIDKEE